jgi:hypothetical protein
MFSIAIMIVVADGSWTSIPSVGVRIHLLSTMTFLFKELQVDQVALDFTLRLL